MKNPVQGWFYIWLRNFSIPLLAIVYDRETGTWFTWSLVLETGLVSFWSKHNSIVIGRESAIELGLSFALLLSFSLRLKHWEIIGRLGHIAKANLTQQQTANTNTYIKHTRLKISDWRIQRNDTSDLGHSYDFELRSDQKILPFDTPVTRRESLSVNNAICNSKRLAN